MTELAVAFLIAHGLLHLAIWMPRHPDPATPPPFEPDHSAVLTVVHVRASTTHHLATSLAVVSAAAFTATGLALAIGSAVVVPAAVVASALGLSLKALYFHPWLTLGVLIDLAVLTSALVAWPVALG